MDRHVLIKRDNEDYHLDLYVDNYGCYTLGHIYDLEMHIRLLRSKKQNHLVRTEEQLRTSSPTLYTVAKVLEILEDTTCGCCDSPWLNSDTFDELVEEFRKYMNDHVSCL